LAVIGDSVPVSEQVSLPGMNTDDEKSILEPRLASASEIASLRVREFGGSPRHTELERDEDSSNRHPALHYWWS
jgi:hypothetical protein